MPGTISSHLFLFVRPSVCYVNELSHTACVFAVFMTGLKTQLVWFQMAYS